MNKKKKTTIFLVVVLLFTSFPCFSTATQSRKELRVKEVVNAIQLSRVVPPNTIDPSRVTHLSWRPRVFLYNRFLSDEECQHLISLANDDNKSSGNSSAKVMEGATNLDISLEIKDEITSKIEERISAWTFLPKGNGKPFHIHHHVGPEEAKENHNYLGNTSTQQQNGESVMATVVMYLSNVTQGGQIIFPKAESGSSRPKDKVWSDCTMNSPITKPIKGNALLFFNLHPNTSLDPMSLHARCPITEGDMWWTTKIFMVKPINQPKSVALKTSSDDLCTDEDDNCQQWAAFGECERNPIFMVGTADYYGTCRRSCNVC
ncbi:oxoglutarate/iron-dependent oxygenase [Artemisia annua]|uniref:procollagen-proline 4-dioxygenase n=1 Tax=Artemisia annua TaxID=35608 RepID=A0A2U1MXV6_ARTAN|nr:oxoglutarate/iron-dependent oxygenase [Artemisia annua]